MRIWWYLLALIFGFLAYMTVWLWPQGPLWSKTLTSNVFWSINSVRGKLMAVVNSNQKVPGSDICRILVFDAKTGEMEKDLGLPAVGQVAPDLQSVIVQDNYREVTQDGRRMNLRDWSIYDLTTGHRRYGPQSDSFLGGRSPDGQWFCTTRKQSGRLEDYLQLRSLKTGEVVHEFPTPEGYHQAIPRFAPHSASVCIFWEERRSNWAIRTDGRKLISIHEVPSGKEIKRVELPKNRYFNVRDWDGETLMIFERTRRPNNAGLTAKCLLWKPLQSASIDEATTDSIIGALETERLNDEGRAEWRSGADWVVVWEMVEPGEILGKWYDQLREWIINRWKFDISGRSKWRVSCYTRAEDKLRLEFPNLPAMPINVSEDGRVLYAYRQEEQQGPRTLEAWDLYPSPRWPWSVATGLGIAAPILLFGRWRAKSKQGMLNHSELKA